MKTFKTLACILAAALMGITSVSCSKEEPNTPPPSPNPGKPTASATHFDIWVTVGATGGMGSTNTILVKSLDSLTVQPTIDFRNDGVDVTATIKEETVYRGKYYYQVPVSADRFAKYQIKGNRLNVIKEQPFVKNTFKDRRYTHAWIDDNTLVIMAANGKADKVIWTKLDARDMSIIAEGELALTVPEGDKFSTSGLARYRKSDNRIIYFFQHKKETKNFYAAFINANDMSIEKEVKEDRAEMMAGTAYGELLQDKMFFDENENLYLACNNVIEGAPSTTQQYGRMLRINKGELDFDKSYIGYRYDSGKIVTASYLTTDKALLYIMDPAHTGATGWGNAYNCYYAILDLKTDARTEMQYQGAPLPYSSGNFSQRSAVHDGKAYIGTNPEKSEPTIYIYDIATGKVEKGMTIAQGYGFDRITVMDNDDAK